MPAKGDRARPAGALPAEVPLAHGKWSWHYRTLIALRENLLQGRRAMLREATEPIEPHGMHPADSATDEYDHDFGLALLAREEHALRDVQEAIYRILAGTYGICEATKKPIPARRLRALPWCRYTRAAELEMEKARQVTTPTVPPAVSVRGRHADIPYTGEIPPEGMEVEPKEHEEPNPGKLAVEPDRLNEESESS